MHTFTSQTTTTHSERTGHSHLEVRNGTTGETSTVLTSGEWEVEQTGCEFIDEQGGIIYFIGNKGSYLERHLCKVPVSGGKVVQITTVPGYHSCTLDQSKTRYVCVYACVCVCVCVANVWFMC